MGCCLLGLLLAPKTLNRVKGEGKNSCTCPSSTKAMQVIVVSGIFHVGKAPKACHGYWEWWGWVLSLSSSPPPSLQLADRALLPPVNAAIVPQSQVVPFPERNVSGFLSMTPTLKR